MGRIAHNFIDIKGETFGRLTVLDRDGTFKSRATWLCKCECGNTTIVTGHGLRNGHTKSCGCFNKERISDSATKHGKSKRSCVTDEYKTWCGIISRCENEKKQMYKYYGGSGITIDPAWRNSFEQFYKDMGPRPSPEHSIDRRNNALGYSKDNCKWSTRKEQCRNRRNSLMVTAFGETKTLIEWTEDERCTVKYATVLKRLSTGWDSEKAITSRKMKNQYF